MGRNDKKTVMTLKVEDYTGITIVGVGAVAAYLIYKNFTPSVDKQLDTTLTGSTVTPNPINNIITNPNPITQALPMQLSGNSFLDLVYSEEQKLIDFYNKSLALSKQVTTPKPPEPKLTQQQINTASDQWMQKATSQQNINAAAQVKAAVQQQQIQSQTKIVTAGLLAGLNKAVSNYPTYSDAQLKKVLSPSAYSAYKNKTVAF